MEAAHSHSGTAQCRFALASDLLGSSHSSPRIVPSGVLISASMLFIAEGPSTRDVKCSETIWKMLNYNY